MALWIGAAVAASGCLGGTSTTLSIEEAPEGRDSLRVGTHHYGDYFRFEQTYEGPAYSRETGLPEPGKTEKDQRFDERFVGASETPGYDRFLRDTKLVDYRFRSTDPTPEEGDTATYEHTNVYDIASRSVLYGEGSFFSGSFSYNCFLVIVLCSPEYVNETIPYRYYMRNPVREEGFLDGQILHLGQNLSFEQAIDLNGFHYVTYYNYTPLREERLEGERVFVLAYDISTFRSGPSPEEAVSDRPASAHRVEETAPPVDWLYVSARSPLPIREYHGHTFKVDDQTYHATFLRDLQEYKPGPTTIAWGSQDPSLIRRLPGAGSVPLNQFVFEAQHGLSYPLSAAWSAVIDDLLLLKFQSFRSSHADARLRLATYLPDTERTAFTWEFTVGDGSDCVTVASRQQVVNAALPPLVQNQDASDADECHEFGTEGSPIDPLVPMDDLLGAFGRLRPEGKEPGVQLNLLTHAFGGYYVQDASVTFFEARFESGVPLNSLWYGRDTVTFSLQDGGLQFLNGTFDAGLYQWPWIPLLNYGPQPLLGRDPLRGPMGIPATAHLT